jgi:hypothetical protein
MDDARFDGLARRVAGPRAVRPASRRRALAWLSALASSGAFVGLAAAGCGGCPDDKPCCLDGRCRRRCGDECCANCFVVKDSFTGDPIDGSEVCCGGESGQICLGRKRKRKDDRCCYPDETCVKGRCCGQNVLGAVKCGGRCCAVAACCNGACCPDGKVCAGDPPACRDADRPCPACEADEQCVGDLCCVASRVCVDTEAGTVCCPVDEYCDTTGPIPPKCCPINTVCNTFRGGRVRP